MPRIKDIKVFAECGVCYGTDLYFVYEADTWCLKQICNDCHTVHEVGIVSPRYIIERIKKERKNK
jgi:hypothetical protein